MDQEKHKMKTKARVKYDLILFFCSVIKSVLIFKAANKNAVKMNHNKFI